MSNTTLPSLPLRDLFLKAETLLRDATPANTRKAYDRDWKIFIDWCTGTGRAPLPASPETVVLFLSAYADTYRITTLRRIIAAISIAHQWAQHQTPTHHAIVRLCLRGIARQQSEAGASPRLARPLLTDDILALLRVTQDTLAGARDRALILIGFAGAFRRSELVALDVGDIEWTKEGVLLHVRRSKTDQEGIGQEKAIFKGSTPARCPVHALREWLQNAGIESGPVFRRIRKGDHLADARLTAQSVSLILRRYAAVAGIKPERLSGHSLRSGFVTQALLAGADYPSVQRQTGHSSITTVTRYDRGRTLFHRNASQHLGL